MCNLVFSKSNRAWSSTTLHQLTVLSTPSKDVVATNQFLFVSLHHLLSHKSPWKSLQPINVHVAMVLYRTPSLNCYQQLVVESAISYVLHVLVSSMLKEAAVLTLIALTNIAEISSMAIDASI
jgi:hypothetical protein